MNKLNKIKYILTILIIIASTLVFMQPIANAEPVGSQVHFDGFGWGSTNLRYSNKFYCDRYGASHTTGTWQAVSNFELRSDDNDWGNRQRAYILYHGYVDNGGGHGGYNDSSKYQIALWLSYGFNVQPDYSVGRTHAKVEEGRNYYYNEVVPATREKVSFSGNSDTILKSNEKNIVMNGTTGTFKLSEAKGNITSMEIHLEEFGTGKSKDVTINPNQSKADNLIELYSDKECTKPINVKDISTKRIYIKNNNLNYFIKKIKINAKNGEKKGYKVNATLWGCLWISGRSPSRAQPLLSADGKEEGKETIGSIEFTVENAYGKIKIIKKGVYQSEGKKRSETINADFKLYCTTLNKWVSGDASKDKQYVDSIDKATTYKSGTTVGKLFATYEYQLVEVAVKGNKSKYYNNPIKMVAVTSDLQKGLKVTKKNNYYASSNVIVYSNRTNTVTVLDERTSGDIKIVKVDDTHKEIALSGAKFKIYCKDKGWLVRNSDGTYKYDGDVKSATEFTSNEKGEAKIECVKYGTYYVYETAAPEGYDITKQDGYENKNNKDPYSYSKDNKWVYLGEVKLNSSNNTVKYTFTNKKIVNLEGKVWLDKLDEDKTSKEYDYVFTDKLDKLLSGIKVNLHISKDVIIDTTTDKDGHYEFNNLNYWNLAESYIEFEYDNKKYVVVDPFVGNDTKINSKAIEEVMTKAELDDEKLTGTDGYNPGRAVTYKGGSNLNKTPLTGYYNDKTYTIEDINLGLLEKINPTMYVSENLQYVKIAINNYTYTYKYGDPDVTNSQFAPTVKRQNEISYSPTKLYPSDIAYNIKNPGGLQVYLVYSIDVKNNMTDPIDDIYNEGKLYLTSLKAEYDKNRFSLSNDQIGNEEKENTQFGMWTGENGIATYSLGAENDEYKNGIESENIGTTYIQLKMNNDFVNKILTGDPDELDALQGPGKWATKANANGYHEYLRTDNVWVDDTNVKDFEGAKGTETYTDKNKYKSNDKYYIHKSLPCSDNSSSLSIKFELGKDRVLSGTVFEDIKEDNSALGNGEIDESEKNRAQNVKVELLDVNKEVTNLYKKDENKPDKVSITQATDIYTSADGNYKIDGVVPGYYYIRFTYGNGSQKMVDTNGNKVDIKSNEYKSTIIKNETIQKAMEATQDEAVKLADWYKHIDAGYNTAIDNLDQRKEIDGYIYTRETVKDKDGKEVTKIKVTDKDGNVKEDKDIIMNINSYTPMIGISVEDDTADVKEIKHDEDGKDITEYKNEFTGFNFGLIKQPDTKITVDKKITNVKFTNQVGTTLVSENPASKQSTYVTALDAAVDKSGSKYAKLEIEPEFIYGSNIELTYEIEIKNNSAKDFVEAVTDPNFGDYYKYGKSENALAKKVTVKVLEDDLDEKFNYNSVPTTTTQTTSYTTSIEPYQISIEPVITEKTESDGTKTTTQYLEMTGWESLESGQSTKTSYTVTALIANDDLDTDYRNDAKVKSLSIDTLSTLSTNSIKEWKAGKTVFTITPTTGENRNQTYWYIAAIALAIGVSGLILIKKKVL